MLGDGQDNVTIISLFTIVIDSDSLWALQLLYHSFAGKSGFCFTGQIMQGNRPDQ